MKNIFQNIPTDKKKWDYYIFYWMNNFVQVDFKVKNLFEIMF